MIAMSKDTLRTVASSTDLPIDADALRTWFEKAWDVHSETLNRELTASKRLMLSELMGRLDSSCPAVGTCPGITQKEAPHGGFQPPQSTASCVDAPDAGKKPAVSNAPPTIEFEYPGVVPEREADEANVVTKFEDNPLEHARCPSKDSGNGKAESSPAANCRRPSLQRSESFAAKGGSGTVVHDLLLSGDGSMRVYGEKGNRLQQMAQAFVLSSSFELSFGILIFMNTIVMAFEVQHRGINSGTTLGYQAWDPAGFTITLLVLEWGFGLLFTIEVIAKVVALRIQFVLCDTLDFMGDASKNLVQKVLDRVDWWNLLDFIIVVFFWVGALGDIELFFDPMLLRLARLGRLLRLLRLVKSIQSFDSLYLIAATIMGSISALFWSTVLILIGQMMTAFILNQMLEDYILDDSKPIEERQEVYRYFGTFSKSLFSMFEITLGNFVPISRTLMDNVSEWYLIFNMAHKCAIGFAVVSVVRGVFMHETFKVAATDDHIMLAQKLRSKKVHRRKMKRLFEIADADGNGTLDREEFAEICKDKVLSTWLGSMELDIHDSNLVFTLLTGQEEGEDDEDDDVTLTLDQLVDHMSKMKGPAKGIDLAEVRHECKQLRTMLKEIMCNQPVTGSKKDELHSS